MDVDAAFAPLRGAFPQKAVFQGTHFKYAVRGNALLIERRGFDEAQNCPIFYYWLLVGERFLLVGASRESKLAPMKTIGESLTPHV